MAHLLYRAHSRDWEDIACIINVPPEVGALQQTTRRHTANYSNYCHRRLETSNLTWQSVRLYHEFERLLRMSRGLDTPQ
jgi:hypothetical protein